MSKQESFFLIPMICLPRLAEGDSGHLVGWFLLHEDGSALDFVRCDLPRGAQIEATDRAIVSETIDEIEAARDRHQLDGMWQDTIRNFSLILSLGPRQRLQASGLAAAREALTEMAEKG